jgi:hypothetical protein
MPVEYAASAADLARMRAIIVRCVARDVRMTYVDGWERRGRSVGEYTPIGCIDHDDASTKAAGKYGSLGYIATGSDIAPLANAQNPRCGPSDPEICVVASGRANSAGLGGPWRGIPKDSGNRFFIALEAANDDRGEPYSPASIYAKSVFFASALEVLGNDTSYMLCLHKVWAPTRKVDPYPYALTWMAAQVDKVLTGKVVDDVTPDECRTVVREELAALYKTLQAAAVNERDDIARVLLDTQVKVPATVSGGEPSYASVRDIIASDLAEDRRTKVAVAAVLTAVDDLRAKVESLTAVTPLEPLEAGPLRGTWEVTP